MTKKDSGPKSAQKTLRMTQRTHFMIEAGAQLDGKSFSEADFVAVAVEAYAEKLFRRRAGRSFDSFNHANAGVRWCRIYAMKGFPLDDEHEKRRAFVLQHRAFFFMRGESGTVVVNVPNVETLCPERIEDIDEWRAMGAKNYWEAGRAMADELRARGLAAPVWPPKKGEP